MKKFWFIKMAILGLAFVVLLTAAVMWLWNWLVPVMFNGVVINFWQAAGILVLTRILFRGFSGMNGHPKRHCNRWQDKWEKMSPEEKEKVRELWKNRCGKFMPEDKQS
jgi:ABC-type multidrug transport system fused ATPase/permease subunit